MGSDEVKRLARQSGADLVGIAPVERFADLPAEADPARIQPEARSVIVLGFQVPRGALRGAEHGTAYHTVADGRPVTMFVEMTYLFCRELEEDGWEAVPLWRQSPGLRRQGVQVAPGRPEPEVILDMDYAAHAAGLGHLGMGKFFLTPEFGPRQVFTAVVTDLELEPDAPFAGTMCDRCGACARACPAGALSADVVREAALCEGKAEWYSLRVENCRICKTGILSNPYSGDAEPWRVGAACGRACVAHLEDSGMLRRTFRSPFRGPGQGEGGSC